MSLMANAPPTAPLAPVPGAATDVALVESELLLIARTFKVLPLVFTVPASWRHARRSRRWRSSSPIP